MLLEMRIENFILIKTLHLEFSKGLNIFTGETGAGKSMIIGALNAGLGEKVNADSIRVGEVKAVIQLVFDVDNPGVIEKLKDHGVEVEDGVLIIDREIYKTNRSSIRMNGRIVTQSLLKEVSTELMDIHGQHAHQALLYPKNHLYYLDLMGGNDHKKLQARVYEAYYAIKEVQSELLKLEESETTIDVDYIKYQINEIDLLNLTDDDDDALSTRFEFYKNIESIHTNLNQVSIAISSEDNMYSLKDTLENSISLIKDVSNYDEKLNKIHESLHNVMYQVDDIHNDIRLYIDGIDVDDEDLQLVEDRMNSVNALKLKHGQSIEEILLKRDQLEKQLLEFDQRISAISELQTKLNGLRKTYLLHAKKLHDSRMLIKSLFIEGVLKELMLLNMPLATFDVSFIDQKLSEKEYRLSPNGIDQVEYLISTNPGTPMNQLAKIASGGEISRIMLAIKIALSNSDNVKSIVFDEVDTGISGQTARVVGEKIYQITKNYQVICITHLPQIAVMADQHYLINKNTIDEMTLTDVTVISDRSQLIEIARMLSGDEKSLISLQNAEEMLKQAQIGKSIS